MTHNPAASSQGSRWRTARYVLGGVSALLALYLSTVNIDWSEVASAFRGASIMWTAIATGSVLVTLSLVTCRWSFLVGGTPSATPAVRSRLRILWDSVVVGQAVNIIAPLRLGEGARLVITSRALGMPVGRVMVGLVLERVLDVIAFAAIVTALMASGWVPLMFRGLVPAVATVVLATIGAAAVLVWFLPPILSLLRNRLFASAAEWVARQEVAMRQGWADITRRHQLAVIVILTALIPLASAATNFFVFKSFDLAVPVVTAFVLVLVLQVGTAVVSVPGNVGVFHYLTVVTLVAWDVAPPTALAAAIVLHIVSIGPKILLGAFSVRSQF